jgi:hypothetical protein
MTIRTDIHRPSAINPSDYVFVAIKYDGPSDAGRDATLASRQIIREHLASTGGRYSTHEHGGTCHICGASAFYLAVFYHPQTNTYICTGEDCAEKVDFATDGFNIFRQKVRAAEGFATGKARAQKILDERNLSNLWALYTQPHSDDFGFEETTLRDIVGKLVTYGSISDKQWAFAERLLTGIPAAHAKRAAILAERAADAAQSQHVATVGERIEFTATVTFVATFESSFGYVTVTGLKDDAGNVYIQKGKAIGSKGERFAIKATVKEHGARDGVKQTIITRPKVLGLA